LEGENVNLEEFKLTVTIRGSEVKNFVEYLDN
jgi:hypothetical protein